MMREEDYQHIKRALFTLKEQSERLQHKAGEIQDWYEANQAALLAIGAIQTLRMYRPTVPAPTGAIKPYERWPEMAK